MAKQLLEIMEADLEKLKVSFDNMSKEQGDVIEKYHETKRNDLLEHSQYLRGQLSAYSWIMSIMQKHIDVCKEQEKPYQKFI